MTPDGSEFVIRTARKLWTCTGCGAAIGQGERHLEYLGETPAFQSGARYCASCATTVWEIDPANFGVV